MTTELRIPQERDLPPGRFAQRKEHLMEELARTGHVDRNRVLRDRRRWRAAAGVAAAAITVGVVAAVAFWPGAGTTTAPAMRLVAFTTTEGDEIVARITHPDAPASDLTAVFQAHGLNIHVKTLPVSPSLVGTIVYSDADIIRSLHEGTCLTGGGGGCVVGLVFPSDFAGEANVAVGRAASRAETYASSAEVFGPGEALHCAGILGQPAVDALPALRSSGLTPEWMRGGQRTDDPSPPSGYVIGGVALSSTTVLLDVSSQPLDTQEFHAYMETANTGC